MNSHTRVMNINFQGRDTVRPNDNGNLCGGGVIENVRLNDLFLPEPNQYEAGEGNQLAVWVAQTQDGRATKNVHVRNLVGMLFRGDGINYHGNVQDSTVEDCHIENTGDDTYAFWGGYAKNV